jgi:peptidoglycan/LPS O-acetylase OafA/YrhL
MTPRADRFPLMDSLRAIAVLGVLFAHASAFMYQSGYEFPARLRTDLGVTIFFVISGFLIYRPWVKARLAGEPSPFVRVYAWRRLLRIVPAYWVALTVVAVCLGAHEVFTRSGVPIYYGFGQAYFWDRIGGGLVQAWSLSVEVAFYAFVPLWALAMRRARGGDPESRLRRELIGAACLFAFSFVFKVAAVQAGTLDNAHVSSLQVILLTFLDTFAVGMALAALSVRYEGVTGDDLPRALRLIDRRPWVPWLVAGVAFCLVSFAIGLGGLLFQHFGDWQYLERHYLYIATAAGLVLPAMFGDQARGWVRRVLANRVLLYIGLVSYGVFLYHFAVLTQLERWGFGDVAVGNRAWLWVIAAAAGGIALATISYYAIERPFMRLKRLAGPVSPSLRREAIEEPVPVAPRA